MFTKEEVDKVIDRCGGYGGRLSPSWHGRIADAANNFVSFESMQLYIRSECPFCSHDLGTEDTGLSFNTYDEFDLFKTDKTRMRAMYQAVKDKVEARYKGGEHA